MELFHRLVKNKTLQKKKKNDILQPHTSFPFLLPFWLHPKQHPLPPLTLPLYFPVMYTYSLESQPGPACRLVFIQRACFISAADTLFSNNNHKRIILTVSAHICNIPSHPPFPGLNLFPIFSLPLVVFVRVMESL